MAEPLEEENARLRERLRLAFTRAGIAGALLSAGSQEQLLDRIVALAERLASAQAAGLYLVDPETGELTIGVVRGGGGEGIRGLRLPAGQGLAGECARTGRTIVVDDVPSDPRWLSLEEAGGYVPRTLLCAPLVHEGSTIGVLQLLDRSGGSRFLPEDVATLGDFAALAAWALVLSRATRDLVELARLAALECPGGPSGLAGTLAEAATEVQGSEAYRGLSALAGQLGEIGAQGPAARQLARQLVAAAYRLAAGGSSP